MKILLVKKMFKAIISSNIIINTNVNINIVKLIP